MVNTDLIAEGKVESLAVNGISIYSLYFYLNGPEDDTHMGFARSLSGHDSDYIKTSERKKGDVVFNWRSWTGLCVSEIAEVERILQVPIPVGCILENVRFSGIPNFSELPPASRLVFPSAMGRGGRDEQAWLAVWEKNGPCATVGRRLADHHNNSDLTTTFVRAAQNRRGVMGFVLSPGWVSVGDKVLVYPPMK